MTAYPAGDPFRCDGARALVTGASRGIGAAIARSLACAGADLALSARSRDALAVTQRHAHQHGHAAHLVPGDLADPDQAERVVHQAAHDLGGLDIVIHAAGVLPSTADGTPKMAPIEHTTSEEWGQVTAVNLAGTVAVCRAAKAHLAESSRASLTFVSSVAGLMGTPTMEAYAVTKAAQISLARSLAVAWARHGIRVNALCPGWVKTDMTAFAANTRPISDWLMAHVPQGRWMTPDEVAPSAVYLSSSAAQSLTGQALVIDGGLSIADGGLGGIPKPPSPFLPLPNGDSS